MGLVLNFFPNHYVSKYFFKANLKFIFIRYSSIFLFKLINKRKKNTIFIMYGMLRCEKCGFIY